MRVDRDGYPIKNKKEYILLEPNPWGRPLAGGVHWDKTEQTFIFTPNSSVEMRLIHDQVELDFKRELHAPAIKRCSQLVQRKRHLRNLKKGKG